MTGGASSSCGDSCLKGRKYSDYLGWRGSIAVAECSAQAVSDNTGSAIVLFEEVTIIERVRIGNALRCEHQQEQGEPQAATDCAGSQVHYVGVYSR